MIFKAEIVFVKIILPFCLGIVLGYCFQIPQLLQLSTILLVCLITLATSINIFYKKIKGWKFKRQIASLYYLLFFTLGTFATLFHTDFLHKNYFAKKHYQHLKVWINNEPSQINDILRFEVAVTKGFANNEVKNCSGTLQIALKLDSLSPIKLRYGDELLISANYLPIEPPYNPAEFDFKQWLASKNVYHQSFIRQEQLVKLASNKGNPIIAYALSLRQQQVAIYRKLIKDDEAFAVASTLILGYRANLSKETLAAYSKTGTIHALSVSGMHVGIIYLMLNALLFFLNRNRVLSVVKVVLIITLIWYYSLLTGLSSSVLRSAIMLSAFIISKQIGRSTNNYNILAFTAFILLAYNPFYLWDVGFQLSFLAVFGLIYLEPKIHNWLYVKNYFLHKIWKLMSISLAAQIATLPLSIYYFHQFPVYFILGNLLISIPIVVLMYLGISILLLKLYLLAPVFEWLITLTNNILKWIADLPFSGITQIWIAKWQLFVLCLLTGLFVIGFTYRKNQYLFYGLAMLLLFQASLSYGKIINFKQQQIVFYSLRKNYAAAFISGNKAILLTDLTADDKNFEFFVKPSLDQRHINHIQFVKWEDDFKTHHFIKQQHQITYLNKSILLIDHSINYKKIEQNPSFDFVWLHQNPKQKIENLYKEVNFSNLIIDASNKDYLIAKFEQKADSLKIIAHVLKKQKAVSLNLN